MGSFRKSPFWRRGDRYGGPCWVRFANRHLGAEVTVWRAILGSFRKSPFGAKSETVDVVTVRYKACSKSDLYLSIRSDTKDVARSACRQKTVQECPFDDAADRSRFGLHVAKRVSEGPWSISGSPPLSYMIGCASPRRSPRFERVSAMARNRRLRIALEKPSTPRVAAESPVHSGAAWSRLFFFSDGFPEQARSPGG